MNGHDVAIVGMSCVFPQANSLDQFWENLVNGVDAIAPIPDDRWLGANNFRTPPEHEVHLQCRRAGCLPSDLTFDVRRFGVMPNIVKHGDPDQFLLIQLAADALQDAGVGEKDAIRRRTDVLIGRGGYSTHKTVELSLRTELFETVMELISRKFPELLPAERRAEVEAYLRSTLPPHEADSVSTSVPNIAASRTANRLDLGGSAFVVDAACASSLIAVEDAVLRLRAGTCDLAIAAGVFLTQTPSFHHVFAKLGAMSPQGVIRPFDRRADGLVVGEGGGAVVLKRLEDAVADQDSIYAVIKGVGSSSDGRELDVLAPSSAGQVRALEVAYADAGVDRDTIGYLEAHGTATAAGDAAEIETIRSFFGATTEPATSRSLGSVKSMIGHLMPAAGMAALIKTALTLSNKIIPPTLHCDQPHEALGDAPFYVNTQVRPWVQSASQGVRRAGVNAFGFGGINAHLVLEEVPEPSKVSVAAPQPRKIYPAVQRETELFMVAGDTPTEIVAELLTLQEAVKNHRDSVRLIDLAANTNRQLRIAAPCKLALICQDESELLAHIETALKGLESEGEDWADEESIYYSTTADQHEGEIVFVLPGMGFPGLIGNYPSHLMELALHYPEIRAEFDFFEDRDRHPDDCVPTSAIFLPPAHLPEEYAAQLKQRLAPPKTGTDWANEDAPEERYLAAMGVTLANWIGWILLKEFQIPVDMIAGQSQGEMAALCAAGVSDFHDTAPGFWDVLNVTPDYSPGARLCFAWASEEKVAPLIAANPGAYLAIAMTPDAVIMGGEMEALEKIVAELEAEQILVQVLPYPPIHTPLLSPLRGKLLEALNVEEIELQPPKLKLYSSITTERYPEDPQGIRDTLIRNVDETLRVWETVQQMYADGARVFVQVGGGHLAAHLSKLLPDEKDIYTVALDVDTRNPLTQLQHLCAGLICAGVPMQLDHLYTHWKLRPLAEESTETTRLEIPLRIDWTPVTHENVPPRASQPPATAPLQTSGSGTPEVAVASPEEPIVAQTNEQPTPPPETRVTDPALASVEAELRESGMPFLGRLVEYTEGESLAMERLLSLDEDLHLRDHLFIYAEEVKPLEERLPILAMTCTMELVAETAAALCPGLGLIGYENIRALRWIGLADCSEMLLHITAQVNQEQSTEDVCRVEVCVECDDKRRFTATVVLGTSYPTATIPAISAPAQADPWPWPTETVYPERRMFHGPRFQGIKALGVFGNPTSTAELEVLPKEHLFASNPHPTLLTDPTLMDCLGQLLGLWCQAYGWHVLPTGIEKIEFHSQPPPTGTAIEVRMELTNFDLDLKQVACNFEVRNSEGQVWLRASGWRDWIFKWSRECVDFTRLPTRYSIAQPFTIPGVNGDTVCMSLDLNDVWNVDLEWIARLVLNADELSELGAIPERVKHKESVWTRAVAKDAARRWWSERFGGELEHPAGFQIGHDALGQPQVELQRGRAKPNISIAHSERLVVSLASQDPVGIDIEPVARDTHAILPQFADETEVALLEQQRGHLGEAIETRLWCAKEAAAKCLGLGLQGRPKQYRAVELDDDGTFLIQYLPDAKTLRVRTHRRADWIIAIAVGGHSVAP